MLIKVIHKTTVSDTRLHSGIANTPRGYWVQYHAKPETALS